MSQQQPQAADTPGTDPSWEMPVGRHRLPREVVRKHQLDRLIAGVATTVAEVGYSDASVERIIGAAGVSRTTFYEHFSNREEAVLMAHEVTFERFLGLMLRTCNSESEWPLKVKAVIRATLEFAAAEPAQAQLLTLDAIAANAEVAKRVLASNDHLAALLGTGRLHIAAAANLPVLTEKAIVGAIAAIVSGRLINGQHEELPELEPQLVELTLTPYIGAEQAARIAAADRHLTDVSIRD